MSFTFDLSNIQTADYVSDIVTTLERSQINPSVSGSIPLDPVGYLYDRLEGPEYLLQNTAADAEVRRYWYVPLTLPLPPTPAGYTDTMKDSLVNYYTKSLLQVPYDIRVHLKYQFPNAVKNYKKFDALVNLKNNLSALCMTLFGNPWLVPSDPWEVWTPASGEFLGKKLAAYIFNYGITPLQARIDQIEALAAAGGVFGVANITSAINNGQLVLDDSPYMFAEIPGEYQTEVVEDSPTMQAFFQVKAPTGSSPAPLEGYVDALVKGWKVKTQETTNGKIESISLYGEDFLESKLVDIKIKPDLFANGTYADSTCELMFLDDYGKEIPQGEFQGTKSVDLRGLIKGMNVRKFVLKLRDSAGELRGTLQLEFVLKLLDEVVEPVDYTVKLTVFLGDQVLLAV